MTAKVTTTNLLGKLGQRLAKAHEQHKGDETKLGFQDLPAGIKRAITKLVSAELGVFKTGDDAGQPFALLAGIIEQPEMFEGQKLRGQRATKTFPLCDQPKKMKNAETYDNGPIGKWGHHIGSFDENYADFLNEMRKMGIDTANAPLGNEAGIRSVLATMLTSKPPIYFLVSTEGWENKTTKKKGVSVYFNGTIAHTPTEAGASGFTGGDDVGSDSGTGDDKGVPEGDGLSLEDVANEAESGDMAAIDNIKDRARAAGLTEDEIENSTSWASKGDGTSLQELIEAKGDGGSGSTETEAEAFVPKVGMICNYQIKNGGKVHQVKIEKISKDGTCELLNVTDKKTRYLAAPLTKLSAA